MYSISPHQTRIWDNPPNPKFLPSSDVALPTKLEYLTDNFLPAYCCDGATNWGYTVVQILCRSYATVTTSFRMPLKPPGGRECAKLHKYKSALHHFVIGLLPGLTGYTTHQSIWRHFSVVMTITCNLTTPIWSLHWHPRFTGGQGCPHFFQHASYL